MSNVISRILVVCTVLAGLGQGWAFSLYGPKEDYHVEALGYIDDYQWAPKNLADEYRLNIPIVYYAVDAEFAAYFGSNGVAAIDEAAAILNSLTNVNDFSPGLTEFPLRSWGVNYSAQALGLFDLRSCALEVLLERFGLADPEEFTWTLRNRALPPGAQCPAFVYTVIKRNFDPITWEPSSYINGNLFSYQIAEFCPTDDVAIAVEYLVDPLAQTLSAVASGKIMFAISTYQGYFHRSLTRDDAGGIRYLLSTANVNWETTPVDSFVRSTNTTVPVLLFPSNLQVFAEQALTNDPATLAGLYPGLDIVSSAPIFTNVVETNVTARFVTPPHAPAGSPPQLVFATNYTTNVATWFVHTFGNVLTNQFTTNCPFSLLTTNIFPSPYAPPGSGISVTNVTLQNFVQPNCPFGSFFILPTNICDYQILSTQLTQVLTFTNLLTNTLTTNIVTFTNASGTNVTDYYEFSQSVVTYFTNTILVAHPVNCPENVTTLFEGIQKVRFVKREFDSLLGQFFVPVTNQFAMTEITNYNRVTRIVERAIAQPDILFTADDIVTGPTAWPIITPTVSREVPNFFTPTNVNILGPGTIQPTVEFTFSKVGPLFLNTGPQFVDEASATLDFIWGSFDGTTNPPVVYPVGTDLMSLQNQMLFQLTSPTNVVGGVAQLPDATSGQAYSFQLEAIGGLTPYTWTLAPGSPGLPAGLSLSTSGAITGTPLNPMLYDFTIRLTDVGARSVDFPFALTVSP